MRILQVSMMDRGGGAERVALDLHRAYRDLGHEPSLAVGYKEQNEEGVVQIPNREYLSHWGKLWAGIGAPFQALRGLVPGAGRIHDLLLNRVGQPAKAVAWWRGHEDFEAPGTKHLLELQKAKPDVVHCHNLHRGYFDLRCLPDISKRVPVILTLHDEWLYTGHCAHSFECNRWRSGCGECPSLETYPPIRRDGSALNWQAKRDILSKSNIRLVTPSQWLMDRVNLSPILAANPCKTVIHNGVDLDVFRQTDTMAARKRLGLPENAKIVMFAHPNAKSSPFKDYATFLRCAHILGKDVYEGGLLLLAVGPAMPAETVGRARMQFVKRVTDRRIMADYYNAADVYLHPAKAENFPLAILEAMACGKPIVASRVGGIPEQVTHGANGFLADVGDSEDMAGCVREILGNSELRARMRDNGAKRAKDLYGLDRMAQEYLRILIRPGSSDIQ